MLADELPTFGRIRPGSCFLRNLELPGAKLPASLTRWLVPRPAWTEQGTRLRLEPGDRTPRGCGYGIALQPEQIRLLPR